MSGWAEVAWAGTRLCAFFPLSRLQDVVCVLSPTTQMVLASLRRYSEEQRLNRGEVSGAVRGCFDAFDALVERLAEGGCLDAWPDPVVAAGESAILLSWADDHGHLELEINDEGQVEVFSMLRDAGLGGAQNLEFSAERDSHDTIIGALSDAGRRVFNGTSDH